MKDGAAKQFFYSTELHERAHCRRCRKRPDELSVARDYGGDVTVIATCHGAHETHRISFLETIWLFVAALGVCDAACHELTRSELSEDGFLETARLAYRKCRKAIASGPKN
jgi:hypothetical protein